MGYPRAEKPGVSDPTFPGPFWFYQIGESLRRVIVAAGLTPSDDDLDPLSKAVQPRARNYIINGDFDVWQRSKSDTDGGYGADDRWRNDKAGSTIVTSRQRFASGQAEVPNNPRFYSRTLVSSVASTANFALGRW